MHQIQHQEKVLRYSFSLVTLLYATGQSGKLYPARAAEPSGIRINIAYAGSLEHRSVSRTNISNHANKRRPKVTG